MKYDHFNRKRSQHLWCKHSRGMRKSWCKARFELMLNDKFYQKSAATIRL